MYAENTIVYIFRIEATLWLKTIDWDPLVPLGIEAHELFHPVDFIKNLGIDAVIL